MRGGRGNSVGLHGLDRGQFFQLATGDITMETYYYDHQSLLAGRRNRQSCIDTHGRVDAASTASR